MKVKQNLSNEKKKNVLRGPKTPKKLKKVPIAKQKLLSKVVASEPVSTRTGKSLNTSLVTHPPSPKQALVNQVTTSNVLDVPPKLVEQSVKILLDLHNERQKNIKVLPLNNRDYVYMQVVWMKKPDVPEKQRKYFKLHHGLFGEDPEVCLFVRDWIIHDHAKRTPDEKIEASIDYYQEYLKTHEIEGISTIMPLFQFKTEYSGYELQRKLVDRFDLFLVQASLMDKGSFLNKLGIAFNKKNKVPLTLKFPNDAKNANPKFKEQVTNLLKTTWYQMKPHGDTASMRIGSLEHTPEQLKENLIYVLNQLKNNNALPGGSENIRSIMLKTSRSKAIPLYMNLASPANIPTPSVKSIYSIRDGVEGDLSTMPGKKVTVQPNGDVFILDDSDDELNLNSDEEQNNKVKQLEKPDESESSEEDELPSKKVVKKVKKVIKKKAGVEENFSEDSDDDVDNAEQQYLTSWNNKADADESDDELKEDDDGGDEPKTPNVKRNKKKLNAKSNIKVVNTGKRLRNNQEEGGDAKKIKKVNEKKTGNLTKPKQKLAGPAKNAQKLKGKKAGKNAQVVKGKKAGKK